MKFQALFRGHLARKHTAFIMNSRRVSLTIKKKFNIFFIHRLILDTLRLMSQEKLFQNLDSMIHMPSERKEIHIPSRQVPLMMVSGSAASEMDSVHRNGQMVLSMKVNGKIIEHTARENSFILTVISMMEIG